MTSPIGPPQYTTKFDPYADRSSKIQPSFTIVDIYPLVMSEDPGSLAKAAQGWTTFATQLIVAMGDVVDYNTIKRRWDSDAGSMFAAYIEGTKSTFSDWYDAATANASALEMLSGTIMGLQQLMTQMWSEFDGDIKFANMVQGQGGSGEASGEINRRFGEWPEFNSEDAADFQTLLDPVVKHYTRRVNAEILEPLNDAYSQAYQSARSGQRFTGPTNGPSETQIANAVKQLDTIGLPPVGGPPGGALPTPPGAVPEPPTPAVPALPPPPARPDRTPPPTAAPPPAPSRALPPPPNQFATPPPPAPALPAPPNQFATPPAPVIMPRRPPQSPPTSNLFALPTTPLRGGPPSGVGAPAVPEPDGVPLGAVGRPAEPSTAELGDRPRTPVLPSRLQGRASLNRPELPRSAPRTPAPQLPGRGGTPRPPRPGGQHGDGPETPPRRGGPALPGRNDRKGRPDRNGPPTGGPDGDDPPNRLGSPRSLLGIRDNKPRLRAGSAEIEGPALRQTTRLNGRLGAEPQLADEFALRALRPGLNGRTAPGSGEPQTKRDEARTDPPRVDFVGDCDLFATQPAGPAVIDRPEEAKPVAAERTALRSVSHKT